MNRTALVFTAVFASLSFGFAADLINTNIVGATGLPGLDAYKVPFNPMQNHYIGGSSLTGGNATSPVDDILESAGFGGYGLFLSNVGLVTVDNLSVIQGGQGSDMNFSGRPLSSTIKAYGGSGVHTLITGDLNATNSTIIGGDGGGIVATDTVGSEVFDVSGGNGIFLKRMLSLHNVDVAGGNGGSIVTSGAGAASTANGGAGVFVQNGTLVNISGETTIQGGVGGSFDSAGSIAVANGGDGVLLSGISGSVTIENPTLIGGNGGTASGSEGSSAKGGSGFKVVNSADVNILGGTFTKGLGGTANGVQDSDGGAIQIENSTVTISGGTFNGDLMLSGTGSSTVSLESSLIDFASPIRQTGGTATFDQWEDAHFTDTLISSGTMNFTGGIFTHEAGDTFALMDQGSVVNFNGGLLAKSNSAINIVYDGAASTAIKGTGLTFEEGVNWTIDGGDTAIGNGDEVVMAIDSAPSLAASTNASYVNYVGSGGSWMGGITSLEATTTQLIGTYGYVSLNKALGTTPGSDFDNAMTDLTAFLDANDFNNPTNYVAFKGMGDAADVILADAYVRAPEMANTLIQLQGVFADQIKDRTRSHLRQQEWGSVASAAPQGAQGWDSSMDWLNDRLPKWDAREAMDMNGPPKAAEAHAPKASRGKIEIPATYQIWGRGYGARIEQDATTGFGGYDANVGGGVVGMDKRFNNLLLGLGGGYAHTTVNGNWGSDGEADTGYGTVYAAVTGEKTFFDFNINYAFNDVETESSSVMQYEGDYNASTVGFYVGGGMGFDWGRVLFTPEASLLTTYYDRESYTETSVADDLYADKQWDDYNEWSYLTSLGATLSMIGQIDSYNLDMEFRPEVRAHWLHEFNAEMDNPTYMMVGGVNSIGVSLQSREEDLIKVGTGIRFSKWDSDTLEFGLDIDGAFGQDYAAYIISGKLMHRF